MIIESVYICRDFDGGYSGRIKMQVAGLIVEVLLTPDEAQKVATVGSDLNDAYERAKAVVREAARKAA